MVIKETILNYLDQKDVTLVFPTESVKRYFLTEYVLSRKSSVLANSAYSFDEFANQFIPKFKDKRPSNKYIRIFFASHFLNNRGSELKYFYNPQYPESKARFIPFVASILPSLKNLEAVSFNDEKIESDLKILYEAYSSFLDEKSLFEPNYFKYDLSFFTGDKSRTYYLVCYDSEINMMRFYEELNKPSFIAPLMLENNVRVEHELYKNEKAELVTLFNRLKRLKELGTRAEDIIISTPNLERLKPYLEKESREKGINLNFISTVKLSQTVAGRLFNDFKELYNTELSFYSLERFLLCPSYPFKAREVGKSLVMALTNLGLLKGSLYGFDRIESTLEKEKLFSELKLYRVIKKGVKRIFESNNMVQNIHILLSQVLEDGEFENCDEEVRNSYAFALKELNSFEATLNDLALDIKDPFTSFISTMDSISYISSEKRSGIRVYSYNQDYLLCVPYHFVIALDDDRAKVTDCDLSFLEDHEVYKRRSYDVTIPLLKYYSSTSENVYLSSSSDTYTGSANAPMYFCQEKLVKKCDVVEDDELSYAIKESLIKGNDRAFYSGDSDIRGGGKTYLDKIKVSYSTLKDYTMCPYITYLKKIIGLEYNNVSKFEPDNMDSLEIGIFLHSIVERFLCNHKNETLYANRSLSFQRELTDIFYEKLSSSPFDIYSRSFINVMYFNGVVSFCDKLFEKFGDGLVVKGVEEKFSKSDGDVAFEGRIDIHLEKKSEGIVIDLKSGGTKKYQGTYQLPFYQLIWNSVNDDKIKYVSYYSFSESSFGDPEKSEELERDIDNFITKAKAGEFNTTVNEDCGSCSFRGICRRRFTIQ